MAAARKVTRRQNCPFCDLSARCQCFHLPLPGPAPAPHYRNLNTGQIPRYLYTGGQVVLRFRLYTGGQEGQDHGDGSRTQRRNTCAD